uniref:Galectin n=1 Tax=Plectus sambesii TaxID=2011161 RepID=A0A914XMY3_9BILA
MSAKDIEIIEITSQEPRGGPRGGPAGRWVNRGRGNPRGGTRGPFTGQPPPPYETIVVPIIPSAPEPQSANAPQVQNVTHVHVTIGGGQGQPRGTRGGQRGGAARGNFSAQRGRGWSQGRAGAEGGEKSNRGGAQSSTGYQRGRGGTPRGAASGQGRGGFNNPPPPVSAPPQPPPPPPPPPRQEFTNPAVPFFATIIGGFTSSSRRITLVATPAARPQQFSVNLKSSSDFLFHFNPRFF